MTASTSLSGVKALLFDVFGTVVDWEGSITRHLVQRVKADGLVADEPKMLTFTRTWRAGYMRRTREIANGAPGPTNVDVLHRELLDEVLLAPEYSKFASAWNDTARDELVQCWHKLDGWADSAPGLQALHNDERGILAGTLSNGSLALLVDLARHADLRWDVVFSGDLLKAYKPNPDMYLGACKLLSLEPHEVCMVAAHIYDLNAAASYGMRTIYVPRHTEDKMIPGGPESVKAKSEGGEVDAVATEGLTQLCALLRA
ncbi:hypothetical protein RQP46_004508 [Phenoliferia psychrophenolica]